MHLDLNEIVAHVGRQMDYELDEPVGSVPDVALHVPVTGKITFTNTGNLLLMRGMIQTSLALECSRCLVTFAYPVRVRVEEQAPLNDVGGGRAGDRVQLRIEPEDEDRFLFTNNVLDLSELLRQLLLLQTPIQPLHDPECAGLCGACGADRNTGPCKCQQELQGQGNPLADALRARLADTNQTDA